MFVKVVVCVVQYYVPPTIIPVLYARQYLSAGDNACVYGSTMTLRL